MATRKWPFRPEGIKTAVPVRLVRDVVGRLAENRQTRGRKAHLTRRLAELAQATWDELKEEARRRFANLSRVE